MLSTKTFVVKKMVYSRQRLDAKPVESCVSVRRADPRCFLRRINSCRAAAAGGEGGGVEEGSGAELSPVPPLLFRISQSVRLPPFSLAPPSEGRCSAASFSSVFALLLPRIVLPSKKRDTDTKWKRVKRQKQDGSDQVDRPLGDGLLRVDVLGFGGIGRVDSRIGST